MIAEAMLSPCRQGMKNGQKGVCRYGVEDCGVRPRPPFAPHDCARHSRQGTVLRQHVSMLVIGKVHRHFNLIGSVPECSMPERTCPACSRNARLCGSHLETAGKRAVEQLASCICAMHVLGQPRDIMKCTGNLHAERPDFAPHWRKPMRPCGCSGDAALPSPVRCL